MSKKYLRHPLSIGFVVAASLILCASGCSKSAPPEQNSAPEVTGQAATQEPTPAPQQDPSSDTTAAITAPKAEQQAQPTPVAPPTPPVVDEKPAEPASTGTPTIEITPTKLDMGTVPTNKPAEAEFTVKNLGDGDLHIEKVKASCGCTKAEADDEVVPPGGETKIHVTLDPMRVHAFETTKSVTITSNDPKKKRQTVRFTAKFEPEFVVEPKFVHFGEFEKGKALKKTLRFRQLTDEPVQVKGVRAARYADGLAFSYEPVPSDQWQTPGYAEYDIIVEATKYVPVGRFRSSFYVNTTCKRLANYSINVEGTAKAFYKVTPQRSMNLGILAPAGSKEAAARITADESFAIKDLKIAALKGARQVDVTQRPGDDPNTILLDFVVPADTPNGRVNSELCFTVVRGDTEYPEKIRVQGRIADRRPQTRNRPPATPPTTLHQSVQTIPTTKPAPAAK